jgi:hypothetical protein
MPQITESDFDECRRHRAREGWKHAMWDAGCKLPTQIADRRSRCFCGAEIDIAGVKRHVYAYEHVDCSLAMKSNTSQNVGCMPRV